MKIREIRVEGFGALRDRTHRLEGRVTVLYGPNEAGKSTLLHLIRAVLFGFPPRGAGAPERFEPSDGGVHGGALVLEQPDGGRVRVARRSGEAAGGKGRAPSGGTVRVTLPDGTAGGEELLRQMLGGVTAEQFKHLFAMTLTELQELSTLTSGELGGFLHSAGLGVRASAVTGAERRLAQELEARYKPRGKNQGIGRLLAEAERQDAEWRRSLAAAGRYNAMAEELERLSDAIEEAEQELETLRGRLTFLRAAGQLRDRWLRRETIREELAALPDRSGFPEDGLQRQEELLQEQERRSLEAARLEAAEKELLERFRAFTEEDRRSLARREELQALLERVGVYRNSFLLEAEWTVEAETVDGQLRSMLAGSGLGADARERLEKLNPTLRHQAEAQRWKERSLELESRLGQLLAEREQLGRTLRDAEERAAERLAELEAHRERLERAYPGGAEEWAPHLPALIRELRRELQEAEGWKRELRLLEERELEHRLQLEQLRAADGGGGPSRHVPAAGLGWLALAAAAGSAVLFGLRRDWIIAGAGLLLLGGLGAALLMLGRSPSGGAASGRAARPYSAVSPLEERRKELTAQLEACRSRIRSRLEGVAFHRTAAAAYAQGKAGSGIRPGGAVRDAPPFEAFDPDDLTLPDRLEQWAAGLAEELRESERLAERHRETLRGLASVKERAAQIRQALNRHEAETAAMLADWEVWLEQWGEGLELPPAFAPDFLVRLEQAKSLLEREKRLNGQIRTVRAERRSFEESVRVWFGSGAEAEESASEALGGTEPDSGPPAGRDPVLLLERAKEALAGAAERFSRMKEAEEKLLPLRQELAEEREALERAQAKLELLWREAGAGGAEEFRRFGGERGTGLRLAGEERTLGEVLAAGVGLERVGELHDLLSRYGQEELADEAARAEQRLAELGARLDRWKERKGQLAAECDKLVEGSEHGERRERQEELLARFRDEASQWAVYAFAAGLLRLARETYERERQPGVLRQASDHFRRMTEGRYERIVAPVGEQRLAAIRPDGEAVDSARLSRGTAEQLYLSIRFALASEFARHTPLPLIMDDIFVNFDARRLEACIRELEELAERHQILVFTCHSHVVEAMEAALQGVQVIRV